MKTRNIIKSVALGISMAVFMGACTEEIKFGDSFLEKAPGGDVTADTVFNNAEYTQQFLTGIYKLQYFGLPYRSSGSNSTSYWSGQIESMSDCWHMPTTSIGVTSYIYQGQLQPVGSNPIYGFLSEDNWKLVRVCWKLIENVDNVPGISPSTAAQYKAEAKCLIASAYFNMFKFYGGLPLVTHSYTVADDITVDAPRQSALKTLNFILSLFQEAIDSNAMPFYYTTDSASTWTGHWTKAAAMAMKAKVLQYGASPLFNDDQPYYSGKYTMKNDSLAWFGGRQSDLWQRCKEACEDFFRENEANGNPYHLVEPTAKTQEAYAYAFRHAYMDEDSPECIMSVRVTNTSNDSRNSWITNPYLRTNDRYAYSPTLEHMEMFPWSDGRPFDYDATEAAGQLDSMFIHGTRETGTQMLTNVKYTRDPRLYEAMCVNGQRGTITYSNGNRMGANVEIWVGGTNAGNGQASGTGAYSNGFFHNKYVADGPSGKVYQRRPYQWVVVRMSDLYLTYAEACLQANNDNATALRYVDKVRSRVGLGGLASCNPSENLNTNKDNLLGEILRERACELSFENTRFFDMQRYKRADLFSRHLHRLVIHRLIKGDDGKYTETNTKWYDGDRRTAKKGTEAWYEPNHFSYERVAITQAPRIWWDGFDVKWYLFPFPQTEVLKGYLQQNPGWQ